MVDLPARPPYLTFGFLSANIHVGVSRRLWLGVVDVAERLGVNLICFPGGVLGVASGEDSSFETGRNAVYALANPAMLDGIVNWKSTITGINLSSNNDLPADDSALFARLEGLPIVNLTQPQRGAHTVSVDSYAGMRAMMSHLIQVHGYRRIAFIRGPSEHYYAQERYRAYLDALEAYAIPFAAELVTPHYAFLAEEGGAAIAELLDARGLRPHVDLDAVAAVSDLLALGALRALRQRAIAVPRDLAVVGFNDSIEARLATPPLTTVDMPFQEQGALAVETLKTLLDGDEVAACTMLQSSLVVRQSCGCASHSIERAAIAQTVSDDASRDLWRSAKEALAADLPGGAVRTPGLRQWQDRVVDALRQEVEGRDTDHGCFLAVLEAALNWVAEGEESVRRWQDVISTLRHVLLRTPRSEESTRLENLFGQARVLVAEIAHRVQAVRQLREERQTAILREIGQALITTVDMDAIADILADRLPTLGIASCFLSLYTQGKQHEGAAGNETGKDADLSQPSATEDLSARFVLGYTESGRIPVTENDLLFPANLLAPSHCFPLQRRGAWVVEPLFFRESQIGFVLFEVGPRDTSIYEVLRGYISSALKGALLVREATAARVAAEKADRIKTRLLANVSHELRTPLHIILENAATMLESWTLPQELHGGMHHIQQSAEHQLRLINDLLDLSRAEIDELDLYPVLLDPAPLLRETFESLAPPNFIGAGANGSAIRWRLQVSDRLPLIRADPVRLRQILLNLLANAQKFTTQGEIVLGAEVAPPHLHLWVADTGSGVPSDQVDHIFAPFVTGEQRTAHLRQSDLRGGIGLGLAITRQLVALHQGSVQVESPAHPLAEESQRGTIFHIRLPLPSLGDHPPTQIAGEDSVLLIISAAAELAPELIEFSRQQTLIPQQVRAGADLETLLAGATPAALAWDMVGGTPGEWIVLRRLRQHPRFSSLPFILFGHDADEVALDVGLTSFVPKSSSVEVLLENIRATLASQTGGCVLIVDDDAAVRQRHAALVADALPSHSIATAQDGAEAIAWMQDALDNDKSLPSLVLLDLMMPGLEGVDVLDWMRSIPRLRQTPVLVLSSRLLTLDDVRRLEHHAHVFFQSKGILSDQETIETVRRVLMDEAALPVHTSALVKHAVAFLHQNYSRAIARWELAEAANVSEDYLSRVFNREIGLSPWEYLNRYRIWHARELLERTNDGINAVARQVGFHDQRYFARVFRKVTGMGPQEYRDASRAS